MKDYDILDYANTSTEGKAITFSSAKTFDVIMRIQLIISEATESFPSYYTDAERIVWKIEYDAGFTYGTGYLEINFNRNKIYTQNLEIFNEFLMDVEDIALANGFKY